MKDARDLKRSYHARHRQAFRHAADLAALLDEKTPDVFDNGDMANARDLANDLLQCVHEINAYRNALLT